MAIAQSKFEIELRSKLGVPQSYYGPLELFQLLMSFWQFLSLHKIECGKSGKAIISNFGDDCPYPVWQRATWLAENSPPQGEFNFSRPFFEQLWELARICPIPHQVGIPGENCEYTDDWWHSKNCYLCHSGVECEDLRYCYRTYKLKDCQFCVSTLFSELCLDVVYSEHCHNVRYAINAINCKDSAFLFDCRSCSDCLFCWNLRGAQYCVENQQLTKEEFESYKLNLPLDSINWYAQAQSRFIELLKNNAWLRSLVIDSSEDCLGDSLKNCKQCLNSFILDNCETCVNSTRGFQNRDNLDCVANMGAELVYLSVFVAERCFDIRYCYQIRTSRHLEYCGFCEDCKDCFACFGLSGGQYCILNKQYSPEEYYKEVSKIKNKIKEEELVDKFFPKFFSPCPYDESIAGYHFPLTIDKQTELGFRNSQRSRLKPQNVIDCSLFPDNLKQAVELDVCNKVFWEEEAGRPLHVSPLDLQLALKFGQPLSNEYYATRLKRLFRWIPFSGELRETKCGISGKRISTQWGSEFDGRILCEEAYLEMLGY